MPTCTCQNIICNICEIQIDCLNKMNDGNVCAATCQDTQHFNHTSFGIVLIDLKGWKSCVSFAGCFNCLGKDTSCDGACII